MRLDGTQTSRLRLLTAIDRLPEHVRDEWRGIFINRYDHFDDNSEAEAWALHQATILETYLAGGPDPDELFFFE